MLWLTDQATWPADGELDAVEAEPVTGVTATAWHVNTKGFFAVYYDGRQFTSLNSGVITGSPLNIRITTSVTPDISQVEQAIVR